MNEDKKIDIADIGYYNGDFGKLIGAKPYPKEAVKGIEGLYAAAAARSDRERRKHDMGSLRRSKTR